ncbi:MAG TPA: discoidin domain-containing protein, partial [Polyangia bacterium]
MVAAISLSLWEGRGRAATRIWAGAHSNDWSTAANWVDGSVPTSSDTAAFKGWYPLTTTNWTVSASHTNSTNVAANVKDATLGTSWRSGLNQASGHYLIVNLGSAQTFSGIELESTANTSDYPRAFDVFVSTDGSSWGSAIASGTGSSSLTSLSFTEQSKQYIKVQLTTTAANWWSVGELRIWGSAANSPVKFSRAGWSLTASHTEAGSATSNTTDTSLGTRWTSGTAMVSGHW